MMERYIQALREYALKDPTVLLGGEDVLGILYECHNENHPYDNDQIKANFNGLYRQTNGMELREMLQLSLKLIKVMASPDPMTFSNRLN